MVRKTGLKGVTLHLQIMGHEKKFKRQSKGHEKKSKECFIEEEW